MRVAHSGLKPQPSNGCQSGPEYGAEGGYGDLWPSMPPPAAPVLRKRQRGWLCSCLECRPPHHRTGPPWGQQEAGARPGGGGRHSRSRGGEAAAGSQASEKGANLQVKKEYLGLNWWHGRDGRKGGGGGVLWGVVSALYCIGGQYVSVLSPHPGP